MLYAPKTYATLHAEQALLPGSLVSAEGQALVHALVNGVAGVKVATGAAGEKFAGFVGAQTSAAPFLETFAPKVEQVTLPASGIYKLARVPLGGSIHVWNVTDAAAIAPASVSLAADGQTATITGGGSKTVMIYYQYTLTLAEFRALRGDVTPGGYAGHVVVNQVSVMQEGVIYTSMFNTAANWRASTAVKLAAGGMLTDQTGTGADISGNVIIQELPTVQFPYLGLRFRTP